MKKEFILWGLVPLLLSSCGNFSESLRKDKVTESSEFSFSLSSLEPGNGYYLDGDYLCPEESNVVPNTDENFKQNEGYYHVCNNVNQPGNISLYGKTLGDQAICVFPANQTANSPISVFPGDTGVLHQCHPISDSGVITSFSFPYNSVFIVDQVDAAQMESCLYLDNYLYCPTFSFGKFIE